eukprot:1159467-Pelagomonas_calceolata.AAC.5
MHGPLVFTAWLLLHWCLALKPLVHARLAWPPCVTHIDLGLTCQLDLASALLLARMARTPAHDACACVARCPRQPPHHSIPASRQLLLGPGAPTATRATPAASAKVVKAAIGEGQHFGRGAETSHPANPHAASSCAAHCHSASLAGVFVYACAATGMNPMGWENPT